MVDYGSCMPKPKTKPLQFKRGSSGAFRRANPILLNGEPAFEWDTKKLKIGDGETRYIKLPYVGDHSKPEDGKSAYQIWIDAGNSGSTSDFLNSLIGPAGKSTYEIWLAIGNEGTVVDFIDDIRGAKGEAGDSAYQLWLKEGHKGDIDDFFEYLHGESAYEIWIALGNKGTEQDFIKSLKGQSAYEIWKDNIGGPDATMDDYFDYFRGQDGVDGKSAYQLWLEAGNEGTINDFLNSLIGDSAYDIWIKLGNTGTEQDFIKSLEGEDGEDGKDGVDGKSAFELWKELTGNPDATLEDYFGAITTASWGDF